MMKIVLIYPRIGMYKEFLATRGYVENMSTYPPLSLVYVASLIRQAGHQPVIIDGNISKLDFDAVAGRIKAMAPDLLGFTLTVPTFGPVYRWIAALRDMFNIPVIVGGELLKLFPTEVMRHEKIDYALIGLGQSSLALFLKAFEERGDFRGIPGLCFREGGNQVMNKPDPAPENLDDLPYPARDLIDNRRYHSPFSEKSNFTPFLTSRGCVFRCVYCCLPGQMVLRRTETVMDEMEECYRRFKIRDFDIYDTVFTADKKRVMDLCAHIRKRKLKISWMARTHINLVDKELLAEMAASGCRMLMYGIESVDEAILKKLGRPAVSFSQIQDKVTMTKRAGIAAFGFFMLGCPGETRESAEETIRASRSLGLDFAQFTRLTPIGGTPLYEEYKETYKHDFWSKVVAGDSYPGELHPVATSLNSRDIERLVRRAYRGFYFRFSQILRILRGVRSTRQLLNFFRACSNILLKNKE